MLGFAQTAEAISKTRSRLEKIELASQWLAQLDRDRLALGARYLGGRVFPPWDSRVLGIGGATMARTLNALTGATDDDLRAAWHKHADPGDVVYDLYQPKTRRQGVDIIAFEHAMAEIAEKKKADQRTALTIDVLRKCSRLEAKYVTRLLAGEIRIGLSEGLVESAIVSAFDADAALVTRANMLLGDLGDVAVLAREHRLETAAPRLFAPLRFMLANAVADADEIISRLGEGVWVEDKYDGIRAQLHRSDDRVELYSRDLRQMTTQFPEIVKASSAIPAGTILDGEILAWKDERVMPFSALQTRLGRVSPSADAITSVPVVYVAWDVLMHGGEPTLELPLRERRARLEALKFTAPLATSHVETAHDAEHLDQLFTEVRARLNEGLMVKNPHSPYLPGRRGLHWLKLKRPMDTLDVVVVGAEWGHGKRRAVMSDVTFAVRGGNGDLLNVGKAYTGLTDAEISEMTELLQSLTNAIYGRYHAVTPQIVLEIAFDTVQESKRHKSGYALRFPRIVHWRRDKSLDDIDTLEKVKMLAESRATEFTQKFDQG